MSKYDVEMKYRLIKKGLKKLGLDYRHDSNHDTATCPKTGEKTTIPRHTNIDKFVVGSICDFLMENGYEETAIKNAFKWK
jgi:hypothetical protein